MIPGRRISAILIGVFLCAFLCAPPGRAEVFWRRPGGDTGSGNSGSGAKNGAARTAVPEDFPGSRVLHTETVETGGRSCELEVGTIPLGLDAVVPALRGTVRTGPDALRVDLDPGPGNWKTRYLLIPGTLRGTTAYFKMRVPPEKPRPDAWPRELPALPGGATVEELIHYPVRGAWYGAFRQDLAPDLALARMAGELEASGWKPLSGEAAQRDGSGRGELFLHPSPRRLLWVNFNDRGEGAVYVRPVKKP